MDKQTQPEPAPLTKVGFIPELKAIDAEARTATHVISSDSMDRGGDIVDVEGWDLDHYQRNPVVLVDHDYRIEKIIGKAISITKNKNTLEATTQFADIGPGFAAFNLVQSGMAKAWSVGFAPQDHHAIRKGAKDGCKKCRKARDAQLQGRDPEDVWIRGLHFTKQQLLEYSLVAVPMNPDAVTEAVQRGFVTRETVPDLFRIVQRDAMDALVNKILNPTTQATPAPAAGTSPKVEPAEVDIHPAMTAIDGALRTLRLGEAGIELRKVKL